MFVTNTQLKINHFLKTTEKLELKPQQNLKVVNIMSAFWLHPK